MVTNILEEQTSFLDMTFPCNGDNLYKTLWCPNQEGHNLYDCSHKNLKPVYILCGFFFLKRRTNLLAIFHIWHVMLHCIVPFYIFSFSCTLWPLSCHGSLYLNSGTWLFALCCSNVIPQHPLLLPHISLCFSILSKS